MVVVMITPVELMEASESYKSFFDGSTLALDGFVDFVEPGSL
jgi:hypothetical protein